MIQTTLTELNAQMLKQPDADAYKAALTMDEAYARDKTFLLKFLRAERFDVQKAATRVAKFFQMKADLFGIDKLTNDIIQDDLDEETMEVLYAGLAIQRLRETDQSGRTVLLRFADSASASVLAKNRATFYMGLSLSADEATQKKGVIGITYVVGERFEMFNHLKHRRECTQRLARIAESLLVRFVGFHACHDSFTWRMLFAIFKLTSKSHIRARVREHFGDRRECQQQLRGFGIPMDCFPIDNDGKVQTDYHKADWEDRRGKERRKRKEMTSIRQEGKGVAQRNARVLVPYKHDVLFGRGKSSYDHPGNREFRSRAQQRAEEYEQVDVPAKKKISCDIVSEITSRMGYFLKAHDDGYWIEVSEQEARRKVSKE